MIAQEVAREVQAVESARRTLTAAIEHLMRDDYRTAASLFRAGARYLDRIDGEARTVEEAMETERAILAFPRIAARDVTALVAAGR